MRDQPEQQAPPVQRLRVRYGKRGRMRFASHRDFGRALERAVARSGLPVAYSSGFHPHPRISYAGAAPTGAASEAEYFEIGLARRVDPENAAAALDEALPEGLDVLAVVEAGGSPLPDRLQASRWRVDLDRPAEDLAEAVRAFLGAGSVPVERMTRRGLRAFDCRAPVVSLRLAASSRGCCLDVVLRHIEPTVRPDDVLGGIEEVGGLADLGSGLVTRLAQGPLDAERGTIGDPFAD